VPHKTKLDIITTNRTPKKSLNETINKPVHIPRMNIDVIWVNSPDNGKAFVQLQFDNTISSTELREHIMEKFELQKHDWGILSIEFNTPFKAGLDEINWKACIKSGETSITMRFSTT